MVFYLNNSDGFEHMQGGVSQLEVTERSTRDEMSSSRVNVHWQDC